MACARWLGVRVCILSDGGLTLVRSVQGACHGHHWSNRRCCEMQRCDLGLDKGKRECDAFWSGLERWVWLGCWRCSITLKDGVVDELARRGQREVPGLVSCSGS
jgi:hypothetical protein